MLKPASVYKKLRLYVSMVRYGLAHNKDFAAEHYEFFEDMMKYLEKIGLINGKRVLDLGCGKAAWMTLLFHSLGANVTGIDTEVVKPGKRFAKYYGIMITNGLERALRTLVWETMFAGPYYRKLAEVAQFDLNFKNVDVKSMDAEAIDFDDNVFDVIVSHEVLEHIPDLQAAAREMKRVLKPTGVMVHYLHNYTSLSGGHHIAWKYPDTEPSDTVPPWDHLRKNLFPDIPSWISRKRESEMREVFEEHFSVEKWSPYSKEGKKLLTEEIRVELSQYSEEELLTKGYLIVFRPLPESSTTTV